MKLETIVERLNSNDRAVSPVIGVILMVAITVILAAVIGTFVLDLGQSAGNSAPSASLTVETDIGGNFTVNHKGGDSLVGSDTRIRITNESTGNTVTYEPSVDETFSVGDQLDINTSSTGPQMIASGSDAWGGTSGSGADYNITGGDQYSVQIIDLESQRVVFETTVTA